MSQTFWVGYTNPFLHAAMLREHHIYNANQQNPIQVKEASSKPTMSYLMKMTI